MKDILLTILSLSILFFPTALKVWRDRKGVKHPDKYGFMMLVGFIILAAQITHGIYYHGPLCTDLNCIYKHINDVFRLSIVSASFYASIFPYWINYVHLKNGITELSTDQIVKIRESFKDWKEDWGEPEMDVYNEATLMHVVSHLSNSAWPDKTKWWRALGWKGRLIVNALILIGGLTLFFL